MRATTGGPRRAGQLAAWLRADAVQDRMAPGWAAVVFGAPFAGWLLLAVLFVIARPAFYLVLQEDHVVEWLQFGLCLFTSVLAGTAAWLVRPHARAAALVLTLVAVGCFILAGEEISWAQRVVGLETPATLREANLQAETNLHNIDAGLDPQTLFKVASGGLGLAGLLAIGIARVGGRGGRTLRALAPPAVTAPGFAGIVGYWLVVLAGGGSVAPLMRFQEWVECALYVSLAASVVAVLLRLRPDAGRLVRRAALAVVVLTLVCAGLTPLSGVRPGNL